jgi:hypothetical protein
MPISTAYAQESLSKEWRINDTVNTAAKLPFSAMTSSLFTFNGH